MPEGKEDVVCFKFIVGTGLKRAESQKKSALP